MLLSLPYHAMPANASLEKEKGKSTTSSTRAAGS
jgi:hypothetical protein